MILFRSHQQKPKGAVAALGQLVRRVRINLPARVTLTAGVLMVPVVYFVLHAPGINLFEVCLLVMTGLVPLYTATSWFVQRPMQEMMRAVRAVEKGESSSALNLADYGSEVGGLAQSISQMAATVGARQSALRKEQEMYQSLFEGAPCLITVQDRQFRLLRFNQAFEERFHAYEGEFCFRAYKNRDCKCDSCPVEKTFQDGLPHSAEESGVYRDGTQAHWVVHTAPIFDDQGNVAAAMEMSLDITKRKRLEEDFRLSQRRYTAIFNSIPLAVLVLDPDGLSVIDCNRSAVDLYGYSKGELVGSGFRSLFANGEAVTNSAALRAFKPIAKTRHVARGGKEFFASVTMSCTQDAQHPVVLAAVTDISERIRAEQQAIQASKMATLGEMAAGVAHEINQPLSVLRMVANFFKRRVRAGNMPDAQTLLSMTDKVDANVTRAANIIDHMREFGRKSNLRLGRVSANAVLHSAFDFFSQQLSMRQITVRWDLQDELPDVMVESGRLEQVCINLFLNARDAIEDKCVQDDCADAQRCILLKTRSTKRHVVVEVHDSGAGIDRELADRLFEPFFTTKAVGKGTGLGLAICYEIVTDYGGTIHALSSELGGARFVVQLPLFGTWNSGA